MKKMNILVVSEQFSKGGLEAHIINQVIGLRKEVNFIFAFGKYESNMALKDNAVYDLGSFTENYTTENFYNQVNKLVEIVEQKEVDVIHAHPFISLLPAIFASVLTGRPMVYTLHGGPSLSANSHIFTYSFLQRFFFAYLEQQVIAIRSGFEDITYDYGVKNFQYIPNSLIVEDYRAIRRSHNNRWAMLARLDNESQTGIFEIIEKIDELGIKEIDIYGVGWAEGIIKEHIQKHNVEHRIKLRGWSDGVVGALKKRGYEGVIGHGQVALDGLMAGFPVLLLSYGRVSGLIDSGLYGEVKDKNFINIYLRDVSYEEIAGQFRDYRKHPDKYILADRVAKDFDNHIIQKQYLSVVKNAKHKYSTQVADMWQRISSIVEKKYSIASELFLESTAIEEIVEECTLRYGFVVKPSLLKQIDYNKQNRELEDRFNQLEKRAYEQKKQIDSLNSIRNSFKLLIKNIGRRSLGRKK